MPKARSGAVLIVNPASGPGNAKARTHQIEQQAKKLGWDGELLETTPQLHAGVLAHQAIKAGYRHIVVCGGDGSIMEALDAVANTSVKLGIVPLGTGNVFAVNLGVPRTLPAALKAALFGTPKRIDLGRANGTYFGVLVGIGWDAAMVRDAKRELKDRFGLFAYLLAAIRNLEHPAARYSVSIDRTEARIHAAKGIIVANMGLIPGGIEAIPKAKPDSGELSVAIIRPENVLSWVALFLNVLTKRLDNEPNLEILTGKYITIKSLDGKQLIEADGNDLEPSESLRVEVVAGGATVLLPDDK